MPPQLYWHEESWFYRRPPRARHPRIAASAHLLYARGWYAAEQPHALKQRILKCRILIEQRRQHPPFVLVTQARGGPEQAWRFRRLEEAQDFGEGWASEIMDLVERESA